MKFPCNNCLLIPLCRHKDYTDVVESCSIICDLLYLYKVPDARYRRDDWWTNITKLETTLQPTEWETATTNSKWQYVQAKGKEII